MITLTRSLLLRGAAASLLAAPALRGAHAETPIRLGVLTALTGSSADVAGLGSVFAAQMAVDDAGGQVLGRPVLVVAGDTQQKPDVGAALAAQMYDRDDVSALFDVPNSGIALAVAEVARTRERVVISAGSGSTVYTGKQCGPTSLQWTFDTDSLATGTVRGVAATGGDTWFLLVSDFAFGHDLERAARQVAADVGARIVGTAVHPTGMADLSPFILQAIASKAKVIGLCELPDDTVNAVKQSVEFGLREGGQRLAAFLFDPTSVHGVGLAAAQGALTTLPFYWDRTDESRAFAKRFFAKMKLMPSSEQAGVYASVRHYLDAVAAADRLDGPAVAERMRALPVRFLFQNGRVLADGRVIHDMFTLSVKAPDDSHYAWDYLKLEQVIPAELAYRRLSDSVCPLVAARP